MTSTQDVAKAREQVRNGQSVEGRIALANEQTADALEAIRVQLVLLSNTMSTVLGAIARNTGQK
jgi:hypothetical protein